MCIRDREYAVDEFLSGIKYFGSDGGDIAYGFEFDHDRTTIIEIPFDLSLIHISQRI